MEKRENFTAERVADFKCKPGKQQSIHWDGKAPGFGLRVTAAGAKSYIFETRLHGKTLRITIGSPDAWPIESYVTTNKDTGEKIERLGARQEATRLKAMTDQGIDPRQVAVEKAAKAEAQRTEAKRHTLTVADAWADYLKARKPMWSERHYQNHEALSAAGGKPRTRGRRKGEPATTIPGPLHVLLDKRLSDIDEKAVREWLVGEVAKRPTWAAQGFRALQAFLNWAAGQDAYAGIAHADACNRRRLRDVLPKAARKSDSLQREQLPAWFAAVRSIGNPVIAAYLQTLLLIGSRREELLSLKWADLDFRWNSMTIRDKVEGERTIPLTPYVSSLLSALPRRKDKKGNPLPWVFSSPQAASGRLQEPAIQHRRACAVAGIEGLTLHGLRRSFASLTEWIECPAGVVAQLMGHKPSATAEKHYKVRPLDMLRMWHTRIEAWILEQAGIEFDASQQQGLRVITAA